MTVNNILYNKTFLLISFLIVVGTVIYTPKVSARECFVDLESSKQVLEGALDDCKRQIEMTEVILQEQQRERTDVEYDILLIDQEINKGLLRIRSSDIVIRDLGSEIKSTDDVIEDLRERLKHQQNGFIDVLQRINEVEQQGFLSLVLSDVRLSSFFSRTNEYEALRDKLEESIIDMARLQSRLESSVDELEEKRTEQYQTRQQQRADVEQVQYKRNEKEEILDYRLAVEEATKDQIEVYETRVGQISNRLFQLRGSDAIPFEEALRYAKEASRKTNVRPAFLLGLIKHESDLGRNVGTGSYLVDMHPTRDRPIFPFITELLGYEPNEQRVSANPGFGWGGAMGPAQFIPSTWVCYSGLINAKTGTCNKTGALLKSKENLSIGSRGSEVKILQRFLNKNGFIISKSGAGSPGRETNEYTQAVASAVSRFQEEYSSRILRQYGYTRGTGTVGPSTRAAINELYFYSGPWYYEEKKDIVRDVASNQRISNPWNPRDAFFASSIYLSRLGAVKDECTAARRYYAGGNWRSSVARNYCAAVLSNAASFQRDIDFLNQA